MKPLRLSPLMLALALLCPLLHPTAAQADGLQRVFSLPGWRFVKDLGNTDNDPGSEMLMLNQAVGYYAVFDASSGALGHPFFSAELSNTTITTLDHDGNGQNDLVIRREDGTTHRYFGVFHFDGTQYVPYFLHSEPILGSGSAHLRSQGILDLIETRSNDIVVRDVVTGTVLWRASVNFPGWNPTVGFVTANVIDVDGDGIDELLCSDFNSALKAFKYTAGSFVPLWSRPGGWLVGASFNSDGDPQKEIVLSEFNLVAPGGVRVVDGLSGSDELDLTAFTTSPAAFGTDVNGDGRAEIHVLQSSPSLMRVYQWNGAGYTMLFSNATNFGQIGLQPMRLPNQIEYIEDLTTDVRLRDSAGNVFFRGSTDLPGWGAGTMLVYVMDIDHDGVYELLVSKGTRSWMVQYRGSMQVIWSLDGPQFAAQIGNMDIDMQDELLFVDPVDESYHLYDGLLGTHAAHWPQYTLSNSVFDAGYWEQNGRMSVVFYGIPTTFPPTPSPLPLTVYRWNGSGYPPAFSFQDSVSFLRAEQHRDASHWELVSYALNGDLVIRDAVEGNQLFRGSTSGPGWTGLDLNADPVVQRFQWDPRDAWESAVNVTGGTHVLRRALGLDAPLAGPASLRLLPAAPNPFQGTTSLRFLSPRASKGELRIFDAAGRVVKQMELSLAAGLNTIAWDGRDDVGRRVPEGVLFYDLRVDGAHESMKLVRLR